ncbi:acyclic terpene utilization AtuA family protein [Actinokineospora sp. NPDC004072]
MIRIANASGFYGDRLSAMREVLDGGPVDVITGDYLAELTMLILGRQKLADPSAGYARTFLKQAKECLGDALASGVKIVVNAGGLNPAGLAAAVRGLGFPARVAHVEGDDLLPRAAELGLTGALTANAYLGGWGIAACLRAGADVVVTGRVTDASLVVGAAAAHHGWSAEDYDALAGATVAGHVIECGAQATGGNFAFFTEIPARTHLGFPIAEVAADGSSVITKHPGTDGAVTVETVTAQLLYEIQGTRYLGPDVTTHFDTVALAEDGPDRVRISGVQGSPPPSSVKVCVNTLDGFRNSATFVLTGLDVEAKAELVRAQLPGADITWTLARTDRADADTQETASALLHATVRTPDPARAKAFARTAVELALASYPGFTMTAPPTDGTPVGVYRPEYVPRAVVPHVAVHPDGTREDIPWPATTQDHHPEPPAAAVGPAPGGPTRRLPLGTVVGARSGDKGGDANLGVWVRDRAAYPWLVGELTPERIRALLPEAGEVRRHEFPNLGAVNFVLTGLLGQGVAASTRFDPQAKGLAEWLRSRHVDIPEELL